MSDERQSSDQTEQEDESAEAASAEGAAPESGDAEMRIAELEAEATDLRNRLLLEMAEMENLRKRTRRETEDAGRYAISKFARDLLTVGDDMRRALEAVPEDARKAADAAIENVLAGVEMTGRQLDQVLERHGLVKFDPAGQKFDPSFHEAMFEVPDPSQPAGTVAHVVEPGYMIGDRVLRPARVGVSKGGPKTAPNPAPDAQVEAEPEQQAEPEQAAAPSSPEVPQDAAGADSAYADPAKPEAAPSADEQIGLKIDKSA